MNEEKEIKQIDLIDLAKQIWAKKKRVGFYTFIGVVVGFFIYLSIPDTYRVVTIVVPESNKKTVNSSMGALAGMIGVNVDGQGTDGINEKIYPEIIKSKPFLMEFAKMKVLHQKDSIYFYEYILEHQKYPWWYYIKKTPKYFADLFRTKKEEPFDSSLTEQSRFAALFAPKINVNHIKDKGVTELSSQIQDAQIAAQVTDKLFETLQNYIINYRTNKTLIDLEATQVMVDNARNSYYEADSLYAVSRDRNQNLISQSAMIKVERYKNEKDLAYSVYQQLASQKEMLTIKLQEQTPIATIIEPVSVPFAPASPNMVLLIIGFGVLFAFVYIGVIVLKELIK